MMTFHDTETARRVREIARREHAAGNGAKMRERIDIVTENVYQGLPSGDYGRGDVRAELLAELDRLDAQLGDTL